MIKTGRQKYSTGGNQSRERLGMEGKGHTARSTEISGTLVLVTGCH